MKISLSRQACEVDELHALCHASTFLKHAFQNNKTACAHEAEGPYISPLKAKALQCILISCSSSKQHHQRILHPQQCCLKAKWALQTCVNCCSSGFPISRPHNTCKYDCKATSQGDFHQIQYGISVNFSVESSVQRKQTAVRCGCCAA